MNQTKYTIVGLLPEEIQSRIDASRRQFSFFNPEKIENSEHVILKDRSHFAVKRTCYLKPDFSEDELLEILSNFYFQPFKININTIGTFPNSNYGALVYFQIEDNSQLLEIHAQIKERIDQFVETKDPLHESSGFKPHSTFLYNIPEEFLVDVQDAAKSLIPVECMIESLYIMKDFDVSKDEREIVATLIATP